MTLIFSFSGDKASFTTSSRIIGPIVHFFFPNLPPENVNQIVMVVRKCAHLTEYALLALLVWRARRQPVRRDPRPWSRKDALFAICVCAAYAATDELHQTFVPNRQGSLVDVLIDTAGAVAGIFALWFLGKLFKVWK